MKKKFIPFILSSLLLTSCANSYTRLVDDGKKVEMSGFSNEISQSEALDAMNYIANVFSGIEDILTYTKEDSYEFESDEFTLNKTVQYREEKTTRKKSSKYDHETYRLNHKSEFMNSDEINFNGTNESYYSISSSDYYLHWKDSKLYILDKATGYQDEMDDEERAVFQVYCWIVGALSIEIDDTQNVANFLSEYVVNEDKGNVVKFFYENNAITFVSTINFSEESESAIKTYTRNSVVQIEVANEDSTIYFRANVEENATSTYKQDVYDPLYSRFDTTSNYGFRSNEKYNYKHKLYYSGMISALLFDEIVNFPELGE